MFPFTNSGARHCVRAFTSKDGVYLEDGTLFRFLLTYEQASHIR